MHRCSEVEESRAVVLVLPEEELQSVEQELVEEEHQEVESPLGIWQGIRSAAGFWRSGTERHNLAYCQWKSIPI